MKFLLLLLISLPIVGNAQTLLNQSETTIKQAMKDVYFDGKKYADDGTAFLRYQYKLSDSDENGLMGVHFYLNDSGNCFAIISHYANQKYLDTFVTSFKNNPDLVKVPNEFGWINRKLNYDIAVTQVDNMFSIMYRTRNK